MTRFPTPGNESDDTMSDRTYDPDGMALLVRAIRQTSIEMHAEVGRGPGTDLGGFPLDLPHAPSAGGDLGRPARRRAA